jgi:hypothetical protein
MISTHTISEGLCMLTAFVLFSPASNDSVVSVNTACAPMRNDYVLIAVMDKRLDTFVTVLGIKYIASQYIGLV